MNHQEKLEVFNEVKADCVWHEKQQAELKEAAMKELMGMMTEAAQQYCEETKKAAEKHEVLN